MQNRLEKVFIIVLFMLPAVLLGQKQINTPYSRFNIGTLVPLGSFRSLAMGGTGVAMRDNNSISFVNPASYSSIDTTSFIMDFGADYSFSKLNDATNKYHSDDMNFGHLLIGFPLARKFGLAAGLVPVSNGYYSVQEVIKEGDSNYNPVAGQITTTHQGDGNLANFFVGTGLNLTKNLSAGVNISILFGELDRINQFEFTDANVFNQYNLEKLKVKGINLDYGLQYNINIDKDYFLTAGVSYTAARNYSSEYIRFSERATSYSATVYSPDTLYYVSSSAKDSTRLPSTLRAGISFGKKDKFTIGLDYVATDWSKALVQGSPKGFLADTRSYMLGIEYIPEKYSNDSFLKRMKYRAGGHISDNYLVLNGSRIKEYGASCGFGMQMKSNSLSEATFYFDFTKRSGNIAKGLYNENFYTIGLSLNLYDFWFIKRKFE
jgi:hypothetical protein